MSGKEHSTITSDSMARGVCIHHLLEEQASTSPDAIAIEAPGRAPLSYERLFAQVNDTAATLNRMAVGRNDRVAIVLPNGPEMATAFLATASCATSAPLNPAYSENEFEFYLSDLSAKALIVQSGMDSPARLVAERHGIRIIELLPLADAEAGSFTLSSVELSSDVRTGFAEPDDVAIVLHTSGTTSRPKIVPLTHRNICVSARTTQRSLGLTEHDRCLNVMPLFHVHGLIGALLSSLTAGASIVCTPGFYAPKFFEWLEAHRPTWYTAVPTMHQAILVRAASYNNDVATSSLRFIRSCSAALPPRVMAELEQTFNVPVIEAYGMTEASHQMASNPLPPGARKPGSVGVAAGPEVAIMDEAGRLLPPSEIGEVVIRGPNVTKGYENNPQATQTAFTDGWFRTGDQGYVDADGYLFLTGRIKEIINRGGEKISPREVDEVLMNHPAVTQAVTFALPDATLGEEVAAAIVVREGKSIAEREIQQFAAARLADFKVPRRVVFLDEIPKGPTGKWQRIGLAERLGLTPAQKPPSEARPEYTAARTPVEETLCRIWSEVLAVEPIGIHDDFFRLGGDSILAAQVISRARAALSVELPILVFFDTPTIAGMAENVAKAIKTAPTSASLQATPPGVERPLSFAQERIWLAEQMQAGTALFNRPAFIRLAGRLDVTALERSLNEIVRRHEVLRSRFPTVDGRPTLDILPSLRLTLPVVDLQVLTEAERTVEVERRAVEEAQAAFDLAEGPLVRASVLRLSEEEHLLFLTFHHTVFDGWSAGILLREVAILYEAFCAGASSPLPEPPVQYADFARWERTHADGEFLEKHRSYWLKQLGGRLPTLALPTDHPRPPVQHFRGGRVRYALPKELSDSLRTLSRQEGVTLFMTLMAAFKVLLARYTAQDDIVVGTLVAGRTQVETETMIGCFINTLVFRTDLSGNPSFRELLERVRRVALDAYAHQEMPFEKLVEALQPERDPSRAPLFQVAVQLRNMPNHAVEARGVKMEEFEFDSGIVGLDLMLEASDNPDGLAWTFAYNSELFDRAAIERMAGHLRTVLERVAIEPDERVWNLPMLTEAERRRIVHDWNATERLYPATQCAHHLFESVAATIPEQTALEHEDRRVTYAELNRQSNQLARYLRNRGTGPEAIVAVCMNRTPDVAIAIMAILKAGGAFLPLDPGTPPERLDYMVRNARAGTVITTDEFARVFTDFGAATIRIDSEWREVSREDIGNLPSRTQPENAAYIIYTSGSTGRPKGVLVTHSSLANFVFSTIELHQLSTADRYLQFYSINGDVFVYEVFALLSAGATVVFPPVGEFASLAEHLETLKQRRITIASLPSSYWHEWVAAMADEDLSPPDSLRLIDLGMEKVRPDRFNVWKEKVGGRIRWLNSYGPTETTITSTSYEADSSTSGDLTSVPIGKPSANSRIYILDPQMNPVPVGVPGELYIGGRGVARGYINRPDLTAERFIPDSLSREPGARLYRTGDVARYLPDGNIEFLGRADHQVKIRGHRIELEEIEAVLEQHSNVQKAAVTARQDGAAEKYLAAYVVARRRPAPTSDDLRAFLKQQLPAYMMPSHFVFLEAMPTTSNGKVDRRSLPAPDKGRVEARDSVVLPRTEMETVIADIWRQVLGVDRVGVYDNFFDLGGHSLLAMQVVARLEKKIGLRVQPREMFVQTLGQQALACEHRLERFGHSTPSAAQPTWWEAVKNTLTGKRDDRN
jgi:amino acid adenylation domain-containing protein